MKQKNRKEHIDSIVNSALNSLEGAGRAEAKPYLFTRIQARMQPTYKGRWDFVLQFISRPAIAFGGIGLVIALNIWVVSMNQSPKTNFATEELNYNDDEDNTTVALLNDIENIDP